MIGWVGVAVAVTTWIGTAMTFFSGRLFAAPGAGRRYLILGTALVGVACGVIGLAPVSGGAGVMTIMLFAAAVGGGAALASFAGYYHVVGIAEQGYRERVLASYGLSGSLQRLIAPVVLGACVYNYRRPLLPGTTLQRPGPAPVPIQLDRTADGG
ncbi:hypothetical protein [Nocardia sp. NPDC051463]|uniref:hypothetical protein n=1 Tax=Nocardia sp. NPDC051463 TaxID=3154845 RepID=UPI00344D3E4D